MASDLLDACWCAGCRNHKWLTLVPTCWAASLSDTLTYDLRVFSSWRSHITDKFWYDRDCIWNTSIESVWLFPWFFICTLIADLRWFCLAGSFQRCRLVKRTNQYAGIGHGHHTGHLWRRLRLPTWDIIKTIEWETVQLISWVFSNMLQNLSFLLLANIITLFDVLLT
jgi:hypothetical protein